jgi:Cd2+/Zn2+-exporting ATPase
LFPIVITPWWRTVTLLAGEQGALGFSRWMAVFADMGASLLVVDNGLRLLRHQA